jgi:hypothetical protein
MLLLSCNSTVIKFATGYSTPENPKDCAIMLPSHISVSYEGDVKEEFGSGDKNELISSFFKNQFIKEVAAQTVFDSVFSAAISNDYMRQGVELKTGKGFKTFYLPSNNQKLSCGSELPSVVILLDEVEISSQFNMSITPGYSGNGFSYGPSFSSSKNLILTYKFTMWNNQKGDLISYGFVESVDQNKFAVTKEDWYNAMKDAVNKLFEKTQFRKFS